MRPALPVGETGAAPAHSHVAARVSAPRYRSIESRLRIGNVSVIMTFLTCAVRAALPILAKHERAIVDNLATEHVRRHVHRRRRGR
jgi:hypothetical protein